VSNFRDDITISKGRDQGVTVGDAVVAGGGLIGQVVEASHSTAMVQLINDPRSSVGVAYGPTNQLYGEAFGQGAGKGLSVQFVSSNTTVSRGEKMYTDGLNGAELPAGIPVGSVLSFHPSVGGGSSQVIIDPAANMTQLAYVAVVQWSPGL
jgi:rod shape-determining protein MreC